MNNLDGVKVSGMSFVDVENFLCVPNHSIEVAWEIEASLSIVSFGENLAKGLSIFFQLFPFLVDLSHQFVAANHLTQNLKM